MNFNNALQIISIINADTQLFYHHNQNYKLQLCYQPNLLKKSSYRQSHPIVIRSSKYIRQNPKVKKISSKTKWDFNNKIYHFNYLGTETNKKVIPEDKYKFAKFIASVSSCFHCGKTFKSNNKLYNHLQENCLSKFYYQESLLLKPKRQPLIVKSLLDIIALRNDNGFCHWNYLET